MHKFNPLDNRYILAAWLWIRCVIFIENLAPGQSPNVRATCSVQMLRLKKQSQSRVLLSIYSPESPCIWCGTDYFQVSFNNKNRLFNYDVKLQCMLVSRTNIRRLYWAICSLQSRPVEHHQFKSSSKLTFSRDQYPKPLNQETILVNLSSHTRPLLRGFSWWGYPRQDTVPQLFSCFRTQNTFPTTWRNPFLHTWK